MDSSEIAKVIIREKVEQRFRARFTLFLIGVVAFWFVFLLLVIAGQKREWLPMNYTLAISAISIYLTILIFILFRKKELINKFKKKIEFNIREEMNWYF